MYIYSIGITYLNFIIYVKILIEIGYTNNLQVYKHPKLIINLS